MKCGRNITLVLLTCGVWMDCLCCQGERWGSIQSLQVVWSKSPLLWRGPGERGHLSTNCRMLSARRPHSSLLQPISFSFLLHREGVTPQSSKEGFLPAVFQSILPVLWSRLSSRPGLWKDPAVFFKRCKGRTSQLAGILDLYAARTVIALGHPCLGVFLSVPSTALFSAKFLRKDDEADASRVSYCPLFACTDTGRRNFLALLVVEVTGIRHIVAKDPPPTYPWSARVCRARANICPSVYPSICLALPSIYLAISLYLSRSLGLSDIAGPVSREEEKRSGGSDRTLLNVVLLVDVTDTKAVMSVILIRNIRTGGA